MSFTRHVRVYFLILEPLLNRCIPRVHPQTVLGAVPLPPDLLVSVPVPCRPRKGSIPINCMYDVCFVHMHVTLRNKQIIRVAHAFPSKTIDSLRLCTPTPTSWCGVLDEFRFCGPSPSLFLVCRGLWLCLVAVAPCNTLTAARQLAAALCTPPLLRASGYFAVVHVHLPLETTTSTAVRLGCIVTWLNERATHIDCTQGSPRLTDS